MKVKDARVIGDQVKCWHCPCTLGQIVNGVEEVRVFAAPQPQYSRAAVPEAVAAIGIRSVLISPPRVKHRLEQTDTPYGNRRRQRMDGEGGIPVKPPIIVAMPVLMPCWRPGCGEPNRVDIAETHG